MISKILTSDSVEDVNTLCGFDESYYSIFKPHIQFILNHREKFNNVPDIFTFQSQFPDVTLVNVSESIEYLTQGMNSNKQRIILVETFNKLKDLGSEDVSEAWEYIANQYDRVSKLDSTQPLNIIKDAQKRSRIVAEYGKHARIPTGFAEIDKCLYGGLSTVEELLLIVARTNTGKSWVATRMMETAQKNAFPVLYYSPEMQASLLGTRFDTWRAHFQNSQLYQGNYNEQYYEYLKALSQEETDAFILEDKDAPDEVVNVKLLTKLVKRHSIKLVIIDGLSYMEDSRGKSSDTDSIRYKNMCTDLFRMSKLCGCAVVVIMQANRATRDNKDDKGEAFPDLYNVEGSDHPGRICTQAFSMRQIFDKHVLDIRLEKSRTANNQKPEFSYSWDINTGNMQYIPSNQSDNISTVIAPPVSPSGIVTTVTPSSDDIVLDDTDEDIEF